MNWEELDNLPFDTGIKPGMKFREVILWMAKDHPEQLADMLEKMRTQQGQSSATTGLCCWYTKEQEQVMGTFFDIVKIGFDNFNPPP